MKKIVAFSLNAEDGFLSELKKKFLECGEFGIGYDVTPVVNQIISAVSKTFKEETKDQKPNYLGLSKFSFEKKEDVYPYFHHKLEENIDAALNRRVHTGTLERFCDLIEKFMIETAEKKAEEKRVKPKPLVDPDKEILAITNYVASTWDGFDKVNAPEFFSKIWNSVTELTKNKFTEHAFHNLVIHLMDEYPAGSEPKIINEKIKPSDLLRNLMIGKSYLSDMTSQNWDYGKNVNKILAEVKKEFPDAGKLKPKGWSKMAQSYDDYDGMKELDSAELKANFKGMDSSTAGASSFEVRVSLPHVMYDDKCQSRKPLEVLVGAMLGHAYVMSEHNNSSKMLTEWVDLCNKLKKSNSIQHEFKEPLNQALYAMIDSEVFDNNTESLKILGIETTKKKLKP